MSEIEAFDAGEIPRTTYTVAPADESEVDIANVTARALEHATGDVIALTVVAGDEDNEFYADIPIPDDTVSGLWSVRWESNVPDAKTVRETGVRFYVIASAFPTP